MKKTFLIFLTSFILVGCNEIKRETLLDFEFGMTLKDYKAHAYKLAKSDIISLNKSTSGSIVGLVDNQLMTYYLDVGFNTNIPTEIRSYIYPQFDGPELMEDISLYFQRKLSDDEVNKIVNKYKSKYGKPILEDKSWNNGIHYVRWEIQGGDIVVYITIPKDGYDPSVNSYGFYGGIKYSAMGDYEDKLDDLLKEKKGVIEIENDI